MHFGQSQLCSRLYAHLREVRSLYIAAVEVKLGVLLTSCNSQRSRDNQATPPTSSFAAVFAVCSSLSDLSPHEN